MKLSRCCGHSGEREKQQAKESVKQRQVREKAKCVLSPEVKIKEAANKDGFIPSTEERERERERHRYGALKIRGILVR